MDTVQAPWLCGARRAPQLGESSGLAPCPGGIIAGLSGLCVVMISQDLLPFSDGLHWYVCSLARLSGQVRPEVVFSSWVRQLMCFPIWAGGGTGSRAA